MIKNQKRAIVLGGTAPHIELIENLKRRGYFTVLIDYYENPPAKSVADEHILESTLDKEKVLEIAIDLKADLIISTSIDQANVTACYVSEKMNLPKPYSYETALKVTNKVLMKEIMSQNDIPTSRFLYLDDDSDLTALNLNYPLVVKPSDSNGSAGVRKVKDNQELNNAFNKAIKISRNKKVIVEEFKVGKEVSVDFFVNNGVSKLLLIREKYNMKVDGDVVIQSPGSFSPGEVTAKQKQILESISNLIVEAFQLNNTSLLIQAIINDEEISILEFAPRVGGGLSFRTVKMNTGFDLVDGTIDSYLHNDILVEYHDPTHFISTNIVYAKSSKFNKVLNVEELLEQNIINEFYYYKTKGMTVAGDMSTKSRIGAFIVKGRTKEEMLRKMKIAIEKLDVIDFDKKSIMRKDIYRTVMSRVTSIPHLSPLVFLTPGPIVFPRQGH